MGKYALLKAVVPVTFDSGFRPNGYEVLDIIDTGNEVTLKKGDLMELIRGYTKKKKDETYGKPHGKA